MAVVLDARYSKDEILEAYLNEIYLGRRGAIAVTGVGEAARYYFGVEVADLDLAQSATLAGMIRAPNAYSPFRNPERTRQRRDLVLRLMREEGKIDDGRAEGRHGRADHAPQPRRGPHARAALRGLRQGRARRALRQAAADRGPADLHDPRRGPAAGGAARGDPGARESREDVQAAGLGLAAGAAAGRADRARAADGRRARARRRPRLPPVAVQPRDPGAPPAGQPLQALRLPRRLRAARHGSAGDAGDDPDGHADHRRVGAEDRRGVVDAAQLRRRLPRPDVGAPGARALDQHPDRARFADGGPPVRARRGQGRGNRIAAARVPLGRARRLRDLADGDRRRLLGLRQQRRARGAERDRGRHDRRRDGARPQGGAAVAGAAGRRGLSRQLDPARAPWTTAPGRARARRD